MNPPPVPSQKPRGFDRGLQFLAGVLAFTVFQRYLIPRELFRPTFPYVLAILAVFTIAPIVVWVRLRDSARRPRTWALVATSAWASLLLSLYVAAFSHGFLKGYSQAKSSSARDDADLEEATPRHSSGSEKSDREEEEVDDILECKKQLMFIEGAKQVWEIDHPPKPKASARAPQRKGRSRSPNSVAVKENPSESDLFGPDAYIAEKPRCPKGGSYIIGLLHETPRCTYPNHSLDFGRVLVVNERDEPIAGATATATNSVADEQSVSTGTNGLSSDNFGPKFYRKGVREIFVSCPGYEPSSVSFSTNWPAKIVLRKKD